MASASASSVMEAKLSRGPSRIGTLIFGVMLIAGLIFIGTSISHDLADITLGSTWPYVLLGLALLVAIVMSVKSGTSGVDWAQALGIGKSLLLSPIFGFILAFFLLSVMKAIIKDKRLYEAPHGNQPPPFWIRSLLVLTCTGVSFFHGSNDGQKGMGLIMLILIGTVPTTYALNHAVTPSQSQDFVAVSRVAAETVGKYVTPAAVVGDPRDDVTQYIRTKEFKPNTMLALRVMINDIGTEMAQFKELAKVPREQVRNFRDDMYVVSEAIRLMQKSAKPTFIPPDVAVLKNYKVRIDKAARFIPLWVKVAVALALGLGTMVGWKRIVVTVGEKIGKNHLTYAQGAAAEITAMATIGAADGLGLPVSTTHVLASGVAGTMMANHSGLQWGTVRNLLMAWVLTLPAAMTLSGFLFFAFRKFIFRG